MKTRRLGIDGPEVSAIGFGAMVLSPGMYGEVDDEASIRTIRAGLDLGLTFLDTADIYGSGHNEELVGQAIADRREGVVLATKGGLAANEQGRFGPDGSPGYLREAVAASLGRLGVDAVDLYYLHSPDPEVPIEDSVAAMAEFVDDGYTHHLGVSNVTPGQLRRANETHPIVAVQQGYSLFERGPDEEDERGETLLEVCRELGVGLVAYGPLGHGLLTGSIGTQADLGENDFRHRLPRFQAGNVEHNAALAARVREVAADVGVSPPQLALAWLLHRDDLVVPIVGTRSVEHLEDNLVAADIDLDAATLDRLDEAVPRGAVKGTQY
jgi:aryl-alcohol dehydrogenase-like predicted oxidoreductase